MTAPRRRTDEEDFQLLAEIEAFSEDLQRLLAKLTSPSDQRQSVSSAPAKALLDESLHWVKGFLVEEDAQEPAEASEMGKQAYALWLFSSYMAHFQGLTILDTDLDVLVEFFFWWYPRHSQAASEALTERLLDSLAAFFAFVSQERDLPSSQVMEDFRPLREKALQMLRLYEQLDSESPYFEEQFEALFGLTPPDAPR